MCGISGYISTNIVKKDIRDEVVRQMNNRIHHRGPDDDGYFSDDVCTLAMRRLSIIDLNTGKQPLFSNCGEYLIFFNGEIYNYRELKEELQNQGYSFKSNSDTEVVVNMYKQFGRSSLLRLKGMFAFCIYHVTTKKFFFARDRFGEKPFFYSQNEKGFVFSSELGALLNCAIVTPKLNHDKLLEYLYTGYVKEPYTLVQGVYSLQPGYFLELYENQKIITQPYFRVKYTIDNKINSIQDAADLVKPYFQNAVNRQMISDVPIGAFLSGGIDSSSVVAMMSLYSKKPVSTFTVKFKTAGYDESQIASLVAKKYNTDHHEITVENNNFSEDRFWRILRHVGHPFPDSSAIPTDIVTSEISKYVKVALSGDGGDEVFGGYTVFDWYSKIYSIRKLPSIIRNSSYAILKLVNKKLNSNKIRQLTKALSVASLPFEEGFHETHALFDSNEVRQLFDSIETIRSDFNGQPSLLRSMMLYRIKYDLPLDMLVKVDRMSMANSLEVRAPFLDPDLFDISCTVPDQFLRGAGLGKLVVREMMKHDLPDEVFNHPKSGFSIPLHDFKNDEFKQLAIQLMSESAMKELFDETRLHKILQIALSSEASDSAGSIYRKTHQLWSLMMLSGWIKIYKIEL
jgi:asparagine synthase (glutamine-hydrolysing)